MHWAYGLPLPCQLLFSYMRNKNNIYECFNSKWLAELPNESVIGTQGINFVVCTCGQQYLVVRRVAMWPQNYPLSGLILGKDFLVCKNVRAIVKWITIDQLTHIGHPIVLCFKVLTRTQSFA